jgi:hypothetical protein
MCCLLHHLLQLPPRLCLQQHGLQQLLRQLLCLHPQPLVLLLLFL